MKYNIENSPAQKLSESTAGYNAESSSEWHITPEEHQKMLIEEKLIEKERLMKISGEPWSL